MSDRRGETRADVEQPKLRRLPPREISDEELAMIRRRRKNRALYQERGGEIVAAHPGRDVLIVREGEILSFERHGDMYEFMEQLDPLTRSTVFMVPRGRQALSTGYLTVHK